MPSWLKSLNGNGGAAGQEVIAARPNLCTGGLVAPKLLDLGTGTIGGSGNHVDPPLGPASPEFCGGSESDDSTRTVCRRPRLMLFTDSFIHGGTERQFVQALLHLDRAKYEIFVGCLKRRGPFLPEVAALGLPIFEFPIPSLHHLATARWFWRLVRFLRSNRIDIVHAFDFYTGAFAVPAARVAGVPVAIASQRSLLSSRTFLRRGVVRLTCMLANGIVANSRAAGAPWANPRSAGSLQLISIPNSIDLGKFRSALPALQVRNQLGIAEKTPLVGTLAALRPEKDVSTFLRAAVRVSAEMPESRFLVIGDGSEREGLEGLAKDLGLAGRIFFVGDCRDVADLLATLDVFVLSSGSESCPNAVLEAMAMSRPVIATKVGGLPELIEEGRSGYLVGAGDSMAMSRRILELLRDRNLRRGMGEEGRNRIEHDFSPAQMKQRLETFYDNLLRRSVPTVRILQIGNYPPPLCGWAMRTQLVQRELFRQGADCGVLDVGPNRRTRKQGCTPVGNGFDYAVKLLIHRARGYTFAVHVNGDSWKGYLIALAAVLLGRFTHKPSFLIFHAGPKQAYFPRSEGFWFHAFRLLFRSSASIICNFEPVKNVIQQYGISAEKIHPIPAFSDQYQEETPVPLVTSMEPFLNAHEPCLFSYTLFRPEFTMDCLFEAFAQVHQKFPRAGLLIVGPREVPPEARAQLRRLGIDSSVQIAGNLRHAEFLTAIKRCDVFVRTHLRDGACASILEALSLGVPVVAAEDGTRPPSVMTYTPADAGDLTRVLVHVLNNLETVRAQVRPPKPRDTLAEEVSLLLSVAGRNTQ